MRTYLKTGAIALLIGTAGLGVAQGVQSISASDKSAGAKAHPQLLEEFGGAYTGSQAAYVSTVGKRIAVQSGLSNSQKDFTVTLLNSPVNNAFAIPGGYVYVTRQLMGLMNDEAELASVLGHEVGHVAARHSNKRNNTSTIASVLAGVVGAMAGNSGLGGLLGRGAGVGAQLFTLRFSRQQEYEADELGIRYLARAGYDPYAAGDILASLDEQTSLDAQASGKDASTTPGWASTHPNSADRVARARQRARETGVAPGRGVRNRDAFLAALDGVVYGDDPRQGVVDGRTFRHPDLRFAFTAPQGYSITNGTSAVTVSGSGGQAQFAGGGSGTPSAHVDQVFAKLTNQGVEHGAIRTTRVNGLDAAYASGRASSSAGQVDVTVYAYQLSGGVFHFVLLTPAGQGAGPFEPLIQSMTPLTAQQAAQIKPRRIDVVVVKPGETVAMLAARMAFPDYKAERFRVLNGLAPDEGVRAGQKVKLVVIG